VQVTLGKVHLIPFEVYGLGDPQTMASHQQDQRGITVPISALAGCLD
jgi:hypothetical protein